MRFRAGGSSGVAWGAGEGRRVLYVAAALCLAATLAGIMVFNARAVPADEEESSAYEDPEKPVVSFILSDPANVEELQREFGLSDREVEAVLAATRAENAALSETYSESEAIVESRSLSSVEKRKRVEASSYDEEVRATVGETKQRIEEELPEERSDDLRAWVDEQWRQEVAEFNAAAASTARAAASGRGITCRVWATYYKGYTRYEVALPHRALKFAGGYKVLLTSGGRTIQAPVKEVGPWNTYDDYWQSSRYRTMWKNLPRCTPEAAAAYFNNYNRGRDEFGRKVLNPAGVDLTLDVAADLGIKSKLVRYGRVQIAVKYPWVRR